MRRLSVCIVVCLVSASTFVLAQNFKIINEVLSGFQETPLTVSTTGNGEFHARISNDETEIQYQLSYSDLKAPVTQSHIHLGEPAISGGITVFLCTNLGNGPAGTQPCPQPPATITGTIRASDVLGLPSQGLGAGQLADLITAIRAGATYVNVHSTSFPTGEIRAAINHTGH